MRGDTEDNLYFVLCFITMKNVINEEIRNINKRIENISKDFTPVTLKSVADYYSGIIWDKGTRKEGQIKTFQEVQFTSDIQITEYQYQYMYEELKQEDFFKQTYYQENINYNYNKVISIMENFEEYDENILKGKSKIEIIRAFEKAGKELNQMKKQGNLNIDSENIFYDLIKEALGINEE